MKPSLFTVLPFVTLISSTAFALVSPQQLAYKLLSETVGQSSCTQISAPVEVATHFEIDVKACSNESARALRQVLRATLFETVTVNVLYPSSLTVSAPVAHHRLQVEDEMQDAFNNALQGNRYFVKTEVGHVYPKRVYSEFKKEIIQFAADNFADLYGNKTYLAQDAFAAVLIEKYEDVALFFSSSR